MSKRLLILFVFLPFLFGAWSPYRNHKPTGIHKVVIDAGHGGHDPGSKGKRSNEKDVTLGISLKLGKLIQENFPDVEVIYTRKTDVFIELFRRSNIANESKADLFISIHCNSTKNPVPRGVETWVMGLHKSKENLEVAKKENASILMEDNYSNYDGFDPNSPEANIIFSLYQNVYLDKSLDFASRVEKQFKTDLGLTDRGVKQAGFWVLYKTTMPGVLVETGFLSNKEDEDYLISDKGQDNVANCIYKAFSEYKETVTSGSQPQEQAGNHNHKIQDKTTAKTNPAVKPADKTPDPPAEKEVTTPKTGKNLVYKVQIASSDKKLPPKSPVFKGLTDISCYQQKKIYKYTTGECSSVQEALQLQSKLAKKGFKDAFVVPFLDGERISPAEAKKIEGK